MNNTPLKHTRVNGLLRSPIFQTYVVEEPSQGDRRCYTVEGRGRYRVAGTAEAVSGPCRLNEYQRLIEGFWAADPSSSPVVGINDVTLD